MHTVDMKRTQPGIGCALCSQIAGDVTGDMIHKMLSDHRYKRRVVDLTAKLCLVPSLGSLSRLHVLLCPKWHSRRIIDAVDSQDLEDEIGHIRRVLTRADSDLAVFEHGASRTEREVPCSVEHAHLHVVEIPKSIHIMLPALQWTLIRHGISGAREFLNDREYLMWSDSQRGTLITQPDSGDHLPSQILRKAVAHAMGVGDRWNWRDHPKATSADLMYERVSAVLTPHDRPSVKANQ
jgi:hypothetical protein